MWLRPYLRSMYQIIKEVTVSVVAVTTVYCIVFRKTKLLPEILKDNLDNTG